MSENLQVIRMVAAVAAATALVLAAFALRDMAAEAENQTELDRERNCLIHAEFRVALAPAQTPLLFKCGDSYMRLE
jgi:hypothetical protein